MNMVREKRVLSLENILRWTSFLFSVLSWCAFIFPIAAEIARAILPFLNATPIQIDYFIIIEVFPSCFMFSLVFAKNDYKDSRFSLVKTIGNAAVLVFALTGQRIQQSNVKSIIATFSLGLLPIFCIVQKFCPIEFGLFNFFITRSIWIIFGIFGLRSVGAWAFVFFYLGLIEYGWEFEEKNLNEGKKSRPTCFMDIGIGGCPEGRIAFELFEELAPKTVENFKFFCERSRLYKIQFCQIMKGSSIVGEMNDLSEYNNDLYFVGERSNLKHDQSGLLSTPMDSKGFKFFITLSSCADYDAKNMVFGRVVKGFCLLKEIENVKIDNDHRPIKPVEVICGGVKSEGDDSIDYLFSRKDRYLDWPEDIIVKEKDPTWWLDAVIYLRILGLAEFKKNDFEKALGKYRKAQRYLKFCFTDQFRDKAIKSFLLELKIELFAAIEVSLKKLEEERARLEEIKKSIKKSKPYVLT